MSDNKNIQDGRDKEKIDINDHSEVEYYHQQWKQFTHAQIVEAIKKYGPYRKDVDAHLTKTGAAE